MSGKKTKLLSGIDFQFVGPGWEDADRDVFQQRLPSISALVRLSFQRLGVDFNRPPQVHLDRVHGGQRRPMGICYNGDLYSVSVKDQHIYGDSRSTLLRQASVNVHEATHALRYRITEDKGLLELLASEGLATYAHDAIEQTFFGAKSALRDMTEDIGEVRLERWRQELLADIETNERERAQDKWFHDSHAGYVIGLWCVNTFIDDGLTLAEVLAMPARDIVRVS